MRVTHHLLLAINVSFCTVSIYAHFTGIKIKQAPEHIGIDKVFMPLVKEYGILAQKRSIKFTHPVTIGFKPLGQITSDGGHIVGLCTYGKNFREIDIDPTYWKSRSPRTQRTLLFHEMTHCLCERPHDYGDGQSYPEPKIKWIVDKVFNLPFYKTKPGYYFDGCPLSIMNPYVLSDECMESHQNDYLYEMLNRCKPY